MRKKNGSTLAELVIVLAIVSIMTILVLSFTAICGAWTRLGIYRYNLQEDERAIKSQVHYFVSNYDRSDYYLYVEDGGHKLLARAGGGEIYSLWYDRDEKCLNYYTIDGTAKSTIENIEDLTFYIRPSDRGAQLVYCRVRYTPPPLSGQDEVLRTYTILVAARSSDS